MKEEKEIDSVIKQDAKTIVDMMFDNDLFKDHVTRDIMNIFENLIAFYLQSRVDSYKRGLVFEKTLNEYKAKKAQP